MTMKNARFAWSGWLVALLLVMAGWATRNEDRSSVDEAAIEAAYERLSEAYATMDVQMAVDQYTDDAYHLIGTAQRILQGKEELALAFSMLENMKKKGAQLAIEYRIVDRTIQGDLAYDVGYYKLTNTFDGETRDAVSKFLTVLKKQADGSWRFQVDHHSSAMRPAFDKVGSE